MSEATSVLELPVLTPGREMPTEVADEQESRKGLTVQPLE
jgi:hypothetical protein